MCIHSNPNCSCFCCRFDNNRYYKNGTKERIVRLNFEDMPDGLQELVDSIYLRDVDAIRACVANGTDVSHRYVIRTALGTDPDTIETLLELGMPWDGDRVMSYMTAGEFKEFSQRWREHGCTSQMLDYLMSKSIPVSLLSCQLIVYCRIEGLDHLISKGLFDVNKKYDVSMIYRNRGNKPRMRYPLTINEYWGLIKSDMKSYLGSKGATKFR